MKRDQVVVVGQAPDLQAWLLQTSTKSALSALGDSSNGSMPYVWRTGCKTLSRTVPGGGEARYEEYVRKVTTDVSVQDEDALRV